MRISSIRSHIVLEFSPLVSFVTFLAHVRLTPPYPLFGCLDNVLVVMEYMFLIMNLVNQSLCFGWFISGQSLRIVFLFRGPEEIPRLYCFFFIFVVPLRWVYYRIKNWHYYLLDYYANVIFVSMLLFYPDNKRLFMLCFSFSEGPLAWALIVWRCSLVFSSIDKIISVVIHLLPGTVFFILRWWDTNSFALNVEEAGPRSSWPAVNSIPTLWIWLFFVPLMVYCVWQALYFAIVEGFRRQRILRDPKLMTSYRELKRKAERANNIWWHLSGLLGAEKRVYMYAVIQAAFTVATLALTVPMFKSYRLHIGFEIFKLAATVWNGGRFIFEVMPRQAAKNAELKKKDCTDIKSSSCHFSSIHKQDTKSSAVHCITQLQYEKQALCSNCERRLLESSMSSNLGDVKDQDKAAALEIIRSTVLNYPPITKPEESCAKQNTAAVGLRWRGQLACVS